MGIFNQNGGATEQNIIQTVKNNFPAVDISTLMGFNLESFAKTGQMKVPGGNPITEMSETSGVDSKRKMLWSTSRFGGSHSIV